MAQVKFNARLGLSVGSTPTDVLDSSGNLLITVPVSAGGTGITAVGVSGNVLTSDGTSWISAAGGGGGGAWSTITGRSGADGPLDVLIGLNTNVDQPSTGVHRVALGYQAGAALQQDYTIAIGEAAGQTSQAANAIAIGQLAGNASQGDTAIAIGHQSGTTSQETHAISIGYYAGHTTQGQYGVALGYGAGNVVQGANAVSVGSQAGEQNQAANAVALGNIAGNSSQGASSVAIGAYAGQTSQAANSIIISATGTELNAASTGFFVAPIRNTVTPVGTKYTLTWDATTKEITGTTTSGGVDLWKYKTAAYTAVTGDKIIANTTGGAFTITLPLTPAAGNTVTIADGGNWSTTNLTVARNGSTVEGVTDDISFNLKGANVTLVYDGTTWQVFSTGAASLPLSGLTDATITSPTTNQVLQWNGTKWVNATVAAGGVTSFSSGTTGLTPSTATTGAIVLAGTLAVANGGTGTATPALVQGTNITITGTWPNQTINAAGGGGLTTTDDVATNASYYPIVATTAGGSTAKTASTKFSFNPSTGSLSATNFTSLSDKNFKNNITTITPSKGLEVVNSLNAVSFNWKDNNDKAYGIIAQEIEEILPEIVTTDEFGIKKVAYNQIIPFLLSAVKALSEEVNALKGR